MAGTHRETIEVDAVPSMRPCRVRCIYDHHVKMANVASHPTGVDQLLRIFARANLSNADGSKVGLR